MTEHERRQRRLKRLVRRHVAKRWDYPSVSVRSGGTLVAHNDVVGFWGISNNRLYVRKSWLDSRSFEVIAECQ